MLFILSCKTWNIVKPGAWLTWPPPGSQQSQDFSPIFAAAAAAAKSLQSCPTLCDPIDGSLPGSPSLGFSRQEHWSGLPFPSPMHESEKWKWSRSVVSDSYRPHGRHPTRLLCPWDFPGKSTGVGAIAFSAVLSKVLQVLHSQQAVTPSQGSIQAG